MKPRDFFIGFLSLLLYELKRMAKGSFSSYLWFVVLLFIATYSLFAENYVDTEIDQSFMTFEYGSGPMQDIIIFISYFVLASIPDFLSGTIPNLTFPASIGVRFFIIVPLILGLTLMGKFILKKAAANIAGEKEKKTLYILASSPQTRPSIYLGKFIGVFILALPMIFFLYYVSNWAFSNKFPTETNLSGVVFEAATITALLFASIGLLISVLSNQEKRALRLGTRINSALVLLTTLWIFIPLFELILNLTNNSIFFLLIFDKITFISPFTMNLMAVYNPELSGGFFNIQMIVTGLFLILGIVIFIRQDLEY